jgi:diadenosine tetraphosphatase ApaH/serine/threonine PP2A family protein phosphatase
MKTIVIGDVHGCLAELRTLVEEVGYRKDIDRCIVAGDIVDRGPDSAGCVKYLMEIGAQAVMGNHDSKLLRRWTHIEKAISNPRYVNPMKSSVDQERTISQLGEVERSWLRALPYHIWLPEYNTVVCHAGMVPDVPLENQKAETLMMVRFIDKDSSKMVGMIMPGYKQPENSYYWAERWNGDYDVIFGHNVVSLDDIQIWQNAGGRAIGIDTGCVYGGRLTALVLSEDGSHQGVQVLAQREYAVTAVEL